MQSNFRVSREIEDISKEYIDLIEKNSKENRDFYKQFEASFLLQFFQRFFPKGDFLGFFPFSCSDPAIGGWIFILSEREIQIQLGDWHYYDIAYLYGDKKNSLNQQQIGEFKQELKLLNPERLPDNDLMVGKANLGSWRWLNFNKSTTLFFYPFGKFPPVPKKTFYGEVIKPYPLPSFLDLDNGTYDISFIESDNSGGKCIHKVVSHFTKRGGFIFIRQNFYVGSERILDKILKYSKKNRISIEIFFYHPRAVEFIILRKL